MFAWTGYHLKWNALTAKYDEFVYKYKVGLKLCFYLLSGSSLIFIFFAFEISAMYSTESNDFGSFESVCSAPSSPPVISSDSGVNIFVAKTILLPLFWIL